MNKLLDKAIWTLLVVVCLVVITLFLLVPVDSLDTGLVYKGF